MNVQLSLSKGEYSLLKDHLKVDNELSGFTKARLAAELKTARVLPRKKIPANVVGINTNVGIRDLSTGRLQIFDFVEPAEARIRHNRISVLSSIGVALLGYREGDIVNWEMPEGPKTYRVEKVSPQINI
jgi:regulator of nucleoside diphosphate kinase